MKKEDFTTRLLKLFFHIQGPFDECRQEIIYKAGARALIQIVYSSLLLFLFYLLFGRFIELVRDAMPYLYFGLIFVLASRARLAVRNLHLDKDDPSEIHHKSYSKSQINLVVGVYSSVFQLACLSYQPFTNSLFSVFPSIPFGTISSISIKRSLY